MQPWIKACPLPTPLPLLPSSLIEDEAPIRDGLEELFAKQGFRVATAADGAAALCGWNARRLDPLILDLMLPKLGRVAGPGPAAAAGYADSGVVLTARDTEEDVVAGIEAGADDYDQSRLASGSSWRGRAACSGAPGRRCAALAVDWPRQSRFDTACYREAGTTVALTTREAELWPTLALPLGRAVGREELLVQVWGYRDGSVRTRRLTFISSSCVRSCRAAASAFTPSAVAAIV